MNDVDRTSFKIASTFVEERILSAGDRYLENAFNSNDDLKKFRKTALKFFIHSHQKCLFISTLAFPNEFKNLEDLYVPLTISATDSVQLHEEPESDALIVDSETDVFEKHKRLLINDNAGMGKSTLSKKIALNTIKFGDEIPIFLELRSVGTDPIETQVCGLLGLNIKELPNGIAPLPLVYILDGLDEVPLDLRSEVAKNISEFANSHPNSKVLVTSRKENHLAEFREFLVMTIDKLTKDEAFEIIKRYDPSGELAEKLIDTIEAENSSDLNEFLSTPLYVSLLFFSYRHKANIPHRKHLFYAQVFDALFERHDLNKDTAYVRPKYSKLDSAQFEQVLRRLAIYCLSNKGKLAFEKNELEAVVRQLLKKMRGVSCNPVSYVSDLISTVPLFVADGTQLRWSHKSLMEYFAAKFICNDTNGKQTKTLLSLHHSNQWSSYYNLFDLCFDIDFSSFRASILKEVLIEFTQHHDSVFSAGLSSRISADEIARRCGTTFIGTWLIRTANLHPENQVFITKLQEFQIVLSKEEITAQFVYYLSDDDFPELSKQDTSSGVAWLVGTGTSRNGQILKLLKNRCPELFLERNDASVVKKPTKKLIESQEILRIDENSTSLCNKATNYKYVNLLITGFQENLVLSRAAVDRELKTIETDDSDGIDDLLDKLI